MLTENLKYLRTDVKLSYVVDAYFSCSSLKALILVCCNYLKTLNKINEIKAIEKSELHSTEYIYLNAKEKKCFQIFFNNLSFFIVQLMLATVR